MDVGIGLLANLAAVGLVNGNRLTRGSEMDVMCVVLLGELVQNYFSDHPLLFTKRRERLTISPGIIRHLI